MQVLSEGKIVEFNAPYKLLQNKDSYFYKMVEQTGQSESERLMEIARVAYRERPVERDCNGTKINGHGTSINHASASNDQ